MSISLLTFAIAACSTSASNSVDFSFEENVGKSDHNLGIGVPLDLTVIYPSVEHTVLQYGGKTIITSASSWETYMGTDAPADVDFDHEWVAFYGVGVRNSGGYGATVTGLTHYPDDGGLIVNTLATNPGDDCIVTFAITTPHTIVKFDIPAEVPYWASSNHKNKVIKCSPSKEDNLAALAASRIELENFKAENGENYMYQQSYSSFFAGTHSRTTLIVEDGHIIERSFKMNSTQNNSNFVPIAWIEEGEDVGAHNQGEAPLLLDAQYDRCEAILDVDHDSHIVNFATDINGLLSICTSYEKICQDDCTRGPQISLIEAL